MPAFEIVTGGGERIDAARAGLRAFPGRRKAASDASPRERRQAADYVCDHREKKNANFTSSFMENRIYFRELT